VFCFSVCLSSYRPFLNIWRDLSLLSSPEIRFLVLFSTCTYFLISLLYDYRSGLDDVKRDTWFSFLGGLTSRLSGALRSLRFPSLHCIINLDFRESLSQHNPFTQLGRLSTTARFQCSITPAYGHFSTTGAGVDLPQYCRLHGGRCNHKSSTLVRGFLALSVIASISSAL
jgi:hypothetical protein